MYSKNENSKPVFFNVIDILYFTSFLSFFFIDCMNHAVIPVSFATSVLNQQMLTTGWENTCIRILWYMQMKHVSCSKCRNRYYRSCSKTDCNIQESTYVPPEQKSRPSLCSPKSISLPFQAVWGPSHSSCWFCKKRGHKFVVPSNIINSIFIEKNIIIRDGSRCCPGHIVDIHWEMILSHICQISSLNAVLIEQTF